MNQGDASNPYYQYYQPPFQNPNPNPNPSPIDPHAHSPWPAAAPYASAPPLSGEGYESGSGPSNHANFSSGYPQSSGHVPYSNPTAPPDFRFPYDQAPHLNPPYSDAAFPNHDHSYETGGSLNRWGEYSDQGFSDEGAFRYEGGNVEPYGARGTAGSRSASETMFDDYGRPIGLSKGEDYAGGLRAPTKVVKAIPKAEMEEDVKSGVQKFRVKLLSEGFGQTEMDVLCQIGLDGIRMLDPATSRMLRIYALDTVTRWEVLDSYIFAFWAKTPIEIEPKRIRLKSNRYTTNTILDTVTAASVQFNEMGDRKESDNRASEQQMERKKSLADWVNFVKPPNEEKDHWIPDESVTDCTSCSVTFNAFVRKHHCRNCGEIFCDKCTQGRTPLTADEQAQPVRVCDRCMGEVTERLENAKEVAGRNGFVRSHEDLAKRLKEEMNKKVKASSGSPSNGSHMQMQEVECPTCTVHLQVQVPSSGSETIECSVCQHPFLVNAQ